MTAAAAAVVLVRIVRLPAIGREPVVAPVVPAPVAVAGRADPDRLRAAAMIARGIPVTPSVRRVRAARPPAATLAAASGIGAVIVRAVLPPVRAGVVHVQIPMLVPVPGSPMTPGRRAATVTSAARGVPVRAAVAMVVRIRGAMMTVAPMIVVRRVRGGATMIVRAADLRPAPARTAAVSVVPTRAVPMTDAPIPVAPMTVVRRVPGDATVIVQAVDRPRVAPGRRAGMATAAGRGARRAAEAVVARRSRETSEPIAAPASVSTWSARSGSSSRRCPRSSMRASCRGECAPSCAGCLRSWPNRPVPTC